AARAPPPEAAVVPKCERGCGAALNGEGVRVGRGGGGGGGFATATLERLITETTSRLLWSVAEGGRAISATSACTSSEIANATSSKRRARFIFHRASNGSRPD
ncbi:MAG: hypothetical protein WAK16_02090, partial [Candidatus Cybelea sp.]